MNITVSSQQMYRYSIYLVYRRLRPALGLPLGFILMYGTYTGSLNPSILIAGIGFFFMHLFGDFYNDYWDFEIDIKNNRMDKFTTIGLLKRYQIMNLSLLNSFLALVFLAFTNIWIFILGIYYLVLLICYSNPKVHLKGHITGYLALASMFLFLPIALNSLSTTELSLFSLIFALFFFTQFMYILCQKDSTDINDEINIFINEGWRQSSVITLILATLGSLLFLVICTSSTWLISLWLINVFSKILNVNKIWKKEITRELRSKLILLEFLTPYLYVGVVYLGL